MKETDMREIGRVKLWSKRFPQAKNLFINRNFVMANIEIQSTFDSLIFVIAEIFRSHRGIFIW